MDLSISSFCCLSIVSCSTLALLFLLLLKRCSNTSTNLPRKWILIKTKKLPRKSNYSTHLPAGQYQNGFQEMEAMQRSMMSGDHQRKHMHMQYMDQQEGNYEKDTNLHEGRQADCSDQIDGEEDAKCRRRTWKWPQSKNLVAEINRREMLTARLKKLRSLVPIISKMDKPSILGDAIEYVKELQKQAKQLQEELDGHAEDEGVKNSAITGHQNIDTQSEIQSQSGLDHQIGPKTEPHDHDHNQASNGFYLETSGGGSVSKQSQDSDVTHDHKTQKIEPQVIVAQLDGNQFSVKVLCAHKPKGFVRLMEALSSLNLEVTKAYVTVSFRSHVYNGFIVEKKNSEILEADEVRGLLLELMQNP